MSTLFDPSPRATRAIPPPALSIPLDHLDRALTAQFVVAWAGEGGEDRRLGWWKCDFISEFGAEDLFRRLLPATWAWATLQGAREAARRLEAERRAADADPDRVISLFSLGFHLDERLDERLRDLRDLGRSPHDALPGLSLLADGWDPARFEAWVLSHGPSDASPTPLGRRIKGPPPPALDALVSGLVSALAPIGDAYPHPHYHRRTAQGASV
jgi:hypothetical protein